MMLSQEDLDLTVPPCGCPKSHPADLAPQCHPKAGVRVEYFNGGRLGLFCLACERPFFSVRVAKRRAAKRPRTGA